MTCDVVERGGIWWVMVNGITNIGPFECIADAWTWVDRNGRDDERRRHPRSVHHRRRRAAA